MKRQTIWWAGISMTLLALVIHAWQHGLANGLNLILLLNFVVVLFLRIKHKEFLRQIISRSEVFRHAVPGEDVVREMVNDLTTFQDETKVAIAGINRIGQDNFQETLAGIANSGIKMSLLDTHEKIVALRKAENDNNWITQGIAAIAALRSNTNNMEEYALKVISLTVKYTGSNQGAFFILKQENGEDYFQLAAGYAYGKRKFSEGRICPGEGIIGQAYYEKDAIYITEVPTDYVRITSGLGDALPRCICVVPLLSEGNMYGAIEIASFEKLQHHQVQFLKKLGEGVGYNLHVIEGHAKTERLLSESQQMAQEVKSQEEELRQNMEELTATQEQMTRKQIEIDAVLSTLSVVELDVLGNIQLANSVFLSITGFEIHELANRLYMELIPEQGNDRKQFEMMWDSISSGRTFSGEFKILSRDGREMWMSGNFTPLLDGSGKPYKIVLVSLFNTQEKEKLFELQEFVSALRACFPIAEINPDLTFKAANDSFLRELGVRRMELKKVLAQESFFNGSYQKLEAYFSGDASHPDHVEISLCNRKGEVKQFSATLLKLNVDNKLKKGLVILTNQIG